MGLLTSTPTISWEDFQRHFVWRQGEHVSVIGSTGSGKTQLALELLPRRDYTVMLATKPRDRTLDSMVRSKEWRRMDTWRTPHIHDRKIIVWPPLRSPEDMALQAKAIDTALREIFRVGKWCVFCDEIAYVCEQLKLKNTCNMYWLQGRSLDLSFVTCAQRPFSVPQPMLTEATHLFLFRNNDARNIKRFSEINAVDPKAVAVEVGRLERFQFLYINTRDGELLKSKAIL